jgi:DNA-binding Lrp family transcriptional regulator
MPDKMDLDILFALDRDPRSPVTRIAHALAADASTTKRRIERLSSEKNVRFKAVLFPLGLGWSYVSTLIILESSLPRDAVTKKLNLVLDLPYSISVGFGDYDVNASFFVRTLDHLSDQLGKLNGLRGVKEADFAMYVSQTVTKSRPKKFNELDWKIVNSLRRDCRKTMGQIASEVDANPKTVRKYLDTRIGHLVLLHSSFRPSDLGLIHALLTIRLKQGERFQTVVREIQRLSQRMGVFVHSTNRFSGSFQIGLGVYADTIPELDEFAESIRGMPEIFELSKMVVSEHIPSAASHKWMDDFIEEQLRRKRSVASRRRGT